MSIPITMMYLRSNEYMFVWDAYVNPCDEYAIRSVNSTKLGMDVTFSPINESIDASAEY